MNSNQNLIGIQIGQFNEKYQLRLSTLDLLQIRILLISFLSKSINESTKICSKKIQILSGIVICIALILSVIIPILISTTDPFWRPKGSMGNFDFNFLEITFIFY